jgi:hypothetical protein
MKSASSWPRDSLQIQRNFGVSLICVLKSDLTATMLVTLTYVFGVANKTPRGFRGSGVTDRHIGASA